MLKLSTKGRYGLRAMIELAHSFDTEPLQMGEIAKRQNFSRKYLHALLTSLKEAGLVKSARGARGGYLLAKEPSNILVSEIFRALEGEIAIIDCLADPQSCSRVGDCQTWAMWKSVNDAMVKVLSGVTLADIAAGNEVCNEGDRR
jgi:Rrf2 family cysteine metabolism transcriptional repressor